MLNTGTIMRSAALVVCGSLLLPLFACGDDGDSPGGGGAGSQPNTSSSGGQGTGGALSSGGSGPTSGGGGSGGTAMGGGGQGGAGGVGGAGGGGPLTAAECFADDFQNPIADGPDYDQFSPAIGSHCMGTNHQDITGVERVVFVGDSVTVGTPPTLSGDYYRNKLADALAQKFGLSSPNFLWETVNVFNGVTNVQESGDFASCSKWGARTDDLLLDNSQLEDCIPPSRRSARTLIVMTMGGNDLNALTQDAIDGVPEADLWLSTQAFVQNLEDAISWIKEPGRFPNGVFVVFGNMYEFTDATGNVQSCDVSGLAGFDEPVPSPELLKDMVVWANEQYLRIAVDHDVDMIFMLEDFCGHGLEHDNPAAPCYRGPGTPQWFDLTCIHPNPEGHQHLRDMFMAVVDE